VPTGNGRAYGKIGYLLELAPSYNRCLGKKLTPSLSFTTFCQYHCKTLTMEKVDKKRWVLLSFSNNNPK
jgi:hypothetical protein